MDLLDLIPIWASMLSALFALVILYLLLKRNVIRTIADPAAPTLFQLIFTFFILLLTGLLQVSDAAGMLLFLLIVVLFPAHRQGGAPFISQDDWFAFSKFFSLILIAMNLFLIKEKGLLFMSGDIEAARLEFFEGWGIFRRFNEAGIGMMTITAAILWERRSRSASIYFALLAAGMSLTLGSKSSLLACLFAYGTYLHFKNKKVSNVPIVVAGIAFSMVTVGIFYLMFGTGFLTAFVYRLLAETDGPFYFFADKMYAHTSVAPGYPFDILATSLRFRLAPIYEPLGEFILRDHFGIDILQGPNPQMFVESHAILHSLGILWYLLCAGVFVSLRRLAQNPYTFFFAMFFVGPLLIDSQYGFSQIFTILLVFVFLGLYLLGKRILLTATANDWPEREAV